RARHATGHVRDAVVNHTIHDVRRVLVRGGLDGLETPALVDRDVDDHGARLHALEILATHGLRGLRTRYQPATDPQVRRRDLLEDRVTVGVNELHVRRHDVGQVAQTLERD